MTTSTRSKRGILTTAFGKQRFIDMAKDLARSLQLYDPDTPRALVTDSDDPELPELFEELIPYNTDHGSPFLQKLYLNTYSPFERTMYIDADSLVLRPLDEFWELYGEVPFGVAGSARLHVDGEDWFMDTHRLLSRYNLESIPKFNGGLYVYDRSQTCQDIFALAQELGRDWRDKGFHPTHNGGPDDEPMFGIAMAVHGVEGVEDHGRSMRTLIRLRGPLDVQVLKGRCRFNKGGTVVKPAIVHFAGGCNFDYRYRRERQRLNWHLKGNSFQQNHANWLPDVIAFPRLVRNRLGVLRRHCAACLT